MKERSVIVDECVSRGLADYLCDRGIHARVLRRGMKDWQIKKISHEYGAYVVTADKGFSDCDLALYVNPSKSYDNICRMLRTLMLTELGTERKHEPAECYNAMEIIR